MHWQTKQTVKMRSTLQTIFSEDKSEETLTEKV
jgi:hypothetical protein